MNITVRGRLWQIVFWPWWGFAKGDYPAPGGSSPIRIFRYWYFGPWKLRRFTTDAEMREAFAKRDAQAVP